MIHKLLQDKKIVLASASPRRKALLKMIGLNPLVVPSGIDEPVSDEPPHLQAMKHARNKASEISAKMDSETIVVGADTIVVLDGKIYGKPETASQASEYLRVLSGKTHKVYTGISVQWRSQCVTRYERTLVEFATLSDSEIEEYAHSKEPMDKAGAYGIQGFGSQFIKRVQGCYFNVMGFPIHLFYCILQDMMICNTSDIHTE